MDVKESTPEDPLLAASASGRLFVLLEDVGGVKKKVPRPEPSPEQAGLAQLMAEMLPGEHGADALLEALLADCMRQGASDLHLVPGGPPVLRLHGRLVRQEALPQLGAAQVAALAESLLGGHARGKLARDGSVDGALSSRGTRFRFNVARRQGDLSIALRRLEDRFRSLDELGLPASLGSLCELSEGLVVVAGPTGAGKSTTLATLLDRINRTRPVHIVTIEDPIEYLHRPVQALVNQREVGSDVPDFAGALVASLRQDPDVILVGEVRDLATIRTAIVAAETGHLVFTTAHAADCASTVERLVAVFPAEEQQGIRRQLGLVLRAIIAQHLLVADGPAARSTTGGPRPRVLVSEVLRVTPAVANLIGQGKSSQVYSAMEVGTAQGMQTLEADLARLWRAQLLSEATALALARDPETLRSRMTQAAGRATRRVRRP